MVELKHKVHSVKSKNAGPYRLTFDLFFEADTYEEVKNSGRINRETIAEAYGITKERIIGIYFVDFINAIKIAVERPVPQGHPDDTDIFGMNQHGPLLTLEI